MDGKKEVAVKKEPYLVKCLSAGPRALCACLEIPMRGATVATPTPRNLCRAFVPGVCGDAPRNGQRIEIR